MNVVTLRGRLSRPAEERTLPSGDRLVQLALTVARPGDKAECVPVVYFDAPATVQGSPAGAAAPKPDAQSPAVGAAVFGRPLPATGGTSSAMAGLALVLLGLAGLGVARPRLSASGGSRPPA